MIGKYVRGFVQQWQTGSSRSSGTRRGGSHDRERARRGAARLRDDRGGDRRRPPGADDPRRRRRGPRERGRPRDGRRPGDAGGHQLHGQARARPDLRAHDRRAPGRAPHQHDGDRQHGPHGDGLHGDRGRQARRHDRDLGVRPGADGPGARRSGHAPGGPGAARPHPAAPVDARGRAAAGGPHRGGRGSRPVRRLLAGGRDLRDHGRAGGDGAPPGAHRAGRAVRPPDDHHQGSDPVPHPEGQAGPAGRDHAPADGLRVLRGHHLRDHGGRPRGPGAHDGRDPRRRPHPGADALGVPLRGRLPVAALRLRGPARQGAHHHRRRGPRRPRLPPAGGARHRSPEQDARLRAAGPGEGHRGGQRGARLQGGPPRLRHRRADPRRPRHPLHAPPHQQPEEDRGAGGLRPPASSSGCRSRCRPPRRTGSTSGPSTTSWVISSRTGPRPPMAGPAPASAPRLRAPGRRVAIVASRFHEDISERLVDGRARRAPAPRRPGGRRAGRLGAGRLRAAPGRGAPRRRRRRRRAGVRRLRDPRGDAALRLRGGRGRPRHLGGGAVDRRADHVRSDHGQHAGAGGGAGGRRGRQPGRGGGARGARAPDAVRGSPPLEAAGGAPARRRTR